MAHRAHHPDLYRLCRAGAQLWSEPAISAAGAAAEVEEADKLDFILAGAGSDRPDRVPVAATGISVHDAGAADRFGSGGDALWARGFSRSQDSGLGVGVGRVPGVGVFALLFRVAGVACG